MESTVYPPFLATENIQLQLPESTEQKELHRLIYEELVRGIVIESSRSFVKGLIEDSIVRHQCDGVILGCTELPLLFEGFLPTQWHHEQ